MVEFDESCRKVAAERSVNESTPREGRNEFAFLQLDSLTDRWSKSLDVCPPAVSESFHTDVRLKPPTCVRPKQKSERFHILFTRNRTKDIKAERI